jgi:hypothetical protein
MIIIVITLKIFALITRQPANFFGIEYYLKFLLNSDLLNNFRSLSKLTLLSATII